MEWYKTAARKVDLGPLRTSRLVMGTGSDASMRRGNQSRLGKGLEDVVGRAYDEGVRFFDMADMYGTHAAVGRALKGKPRDSYRLCTKIWVRPGNLPETDRPPAKKLMDRFLGEIGVDRVDLVQIHCMVDPKWPSKYRKYMDDLSRMKDEGVIGAHGVSCHSLGALETAVESDWVDVVHARLNPYGVRMDAEPEKVMPLLARAKENGKGVMAMKLNGGGAFDKRRRSESVRFALSAGCVDCLIMGVESEFELSEFKDVVEESSAERNPSS